MTALGDASKARYEDRMTEHLRRCFPDQCEKMDEPGIRRIIAQGIEHAKRYNIVTERDVCLFIDLMFIFGEEFDTSPNLPWMSEILTDPHRTDPSRKIDHLYDVALEVLKQHA